MIAEREKKGIIEGNKYIWRNGNLEYRWNQQLKTFKIVQ